MKQTEKISLKVLIVYASLFVLALTAFGFGGERGFSFVSAGTFLISLLLLLSRNKNLDKKELKELIVWALPFLIFLLFVSFGRFWYTYSYSVEKESINLVGYLSNGFLNVLGVLGYAIIGLLFKKDEENVGYSHLLLYSILIGLALAVSINLIATLVNYGPFYRLIYKGKVYYYDSLSYLIDKEMTVLDGFRFEAVKVEGGSALPFMLAAVLGSLFFISPKENKTGFVIVAACGGIGLISLALQPNLLALCLLMPIYGLAAFIRYVKTGRQTPKLEKIVGFSLLGVILFLVALMMIVAIKGDDVYKGIFKKIFDNQSLTAPISQIINATFKNGHAFDFKGILGGLAVFSKYNPLVLSTSNFGLKEVAWSAINLHTFEFVALMEGGLFAFLALGIFIVVMAMTLRKNVRSEEKTSLSAIIPLLLIVAYFVHMSLNHSSFPTVGRSGVYRSAFLFNPLFDLVVALSFYSYVPLYRKKSKKVGF